jgi:hypothetical protein
MKQRELTTKSHELESRKDTKVQLMSQVCYYLSYGEGAADYLLSHSIDFRFVSIHVHLWLQFDVVPRESDLYPASR